MRIVLWIGLMALFAEGIDYSVTPQESRGYGGVSSQNRLGNTRVTPAQRSSTRHGKITPQISTQGGHSYYQQKNNRLPVQVIPPQGGGPNRGTQGGSELNVRVYPPNSQQNPADSQNRLNVQVSPASKDITQDMMFYKLKVQKQNILPPRKKVAPPPPPPPPPLPEPVYEYDDNDVQPLFERNRKGVMIGLGIGGDFERLWIGSKTSSKYYYQDSFTYYFRLGYQYYFTDYLGLRAYAHLGHWANKVSDTFFDGQRDVGIEGSAELNYSFYAEVLYDFYVGRIHSFGLFGGFGVGVGYASFSNDETDLREGYFPLPMVSGGFAWTVYENNRFEFEVKAPLMQAVLLNTWRAEFSSWMLGVSYTYVF